MQIVHDRRDISILDSLPGRVPVEFHQKDLTCGKTHTLEEMKPLNELEGIWAADAFQPSC